MRALFAYWPGNEYDKTHLIDFIEGRINFGKPDWIALCQDCLEAGMQIRLNPAEPCEVQTSPDGTNWTTLFNRCESPEYTYRLYVTPAGGVAASFLAWDSVAGGDIGEPIPGLYRLEREDSAGNIEDEYLVFNLGVKVASVQTLINAPPNTLTVSYDDGTRQDLEIGLNAVTYSTGQGQGQASLSADKKTLDITFPAAGQDGAPGAPGLPGQDGQDGVGIASVTPVAIAGGTQITIALTNGQQQTFTVLNGAQGVQGLPGQDGLTPQVTASAFGLPAGSQPTVTTTQAGANVNLRFGIPAGRGSIPPEVPESRRGLQNVCAGSEGLIDWWLDFFTYFLDEVDFFIDGVKNITNTVIAIIEFGTAGAAELAPVDEVANLVFSTREQAQALDRLYINNPSRIETWKCDLYCLIKDNDGIFDQSVFNAFWTDIADDDPSAAYFALVITQSVGYGPSAFRFDLHSYDTSNNCEVLCIDCQDEESEWVLSLGDGVVQTGQYTFQMTAYLVPATGRYIAGFRGSWTRGAEVVNFCPTAVDIVTSAPVALAVHAPCAGAQAGGFPGSSTPFDYIYVEFESAQTITITIAPPTPPPN